MNNVESLIWALFFLFLGFLGKKLINAPPKEKSLTAHYFAALIAVWCSIILGVFWLFFSLIKILNLFP
jgi:membrane protein DedA with SNARE-associated domain